MYCQFENRYTMTEEMIQEYLRQIVCRKLIKCCFALFLLFVAICGGAWYLGNRGAAVVFGVFAITSLIFGVSAPVLAARQVRVPSAPAAAAETVVQFGDRILVQDCGVQIWFDYREITAVKILDHISVLQVGRWEAIILAPSGFSKGDRFTFWRFFRAKRPDLWVKTAA